MLQEYTQSLNANIYLNAAAELGYKITVIAPKIGLAKISSKDKSIHVFGNILETNNRLRSAIAQNKYATNKFLKKEFPQFLPECLFINREEDNKYEKIYAYCKKKNYRIVIKPVGLSCGKGVHLLPSTQKEIDSAIEDILSYPGQDILIEDFIEGVNEYRVVIVNGELFDVLRRVPAFVTGDGTHTIRELVEKKNKFRSEHNFPLIRPDAQMNKILEEQDVDIESVLEVGVEIDLRLACNFHEGGEIIRIDLNKIDKSKIDFFQRIALAFELQFIGLDIIDNDLTKNIKEEIPIINEVNSSPMPDIHYYADIIESNPLHTAKQLISTFL